MVGTVLITPRPPLVPSSLTIHANTSSGNGAADVTLPSGIEPGDLIIIWDKKYNLAGAAPVSVTPTDFVVGATVTAGFGRANVILKIAQGWESATPVTGMAGDGGSMLCLVLRGNQPINEAVVFDVAGEMTDANPSGQTINASGGNAPLAVLAFFGRNPLIAGNVINPRTFSPAHDLEMNDSTFTYGKVKIYNSSPQSHTCDMDDEGFGNVLQSCYVEVS